MAKSRRNSRRKRSRTLRVSRKSVRRVSRKSVRGGLSKIKLEKGSLPGYKLDLPIKERRKALERALKKNGYLPVMKKVNILSIFLRRSSPMKSARAEKDKKWIMKNFKGKIPNETLAHKRRVKRKSANKKKY
jgi:hypothetical protein